MRRLLMVLTVLLVACGSDLPADPTGGVLPPGQSLISVTFVKSGIDRQVAQFDLALRREDGSLAQRKQARSNASSSQQVDFSVDAADYDLVVVFKDRSERPVGAGHQKVRVTPGSVARATFARSEKPQSLKVTPAIVRAEVGGVATFKARATLESGDIADVSCGVNWNSNAPTVATVDDLGVAQALANGSALIQARFGDLAQAQAALNVGQGFVSVPTFDYGRKTGIHIRVGGGKRVFTELDTGSGALVVGQSHVGPNVTMTDTPVTITYAHGTNPRPGTLGYAQIELLDDQDTVLSTTGTIPILVVADDVVSGGGRNNAIFGLRLNSAVTPRIFFPEPYNQGFVLNRPGNEIRFGAFKTEDFATVQLGPTPGDDSGLTGGSPPASTLFWDDAAVPITYQFSGGPAPVVWNSLVDTGADSSLQSLPLPPFLVLDGAGVILNTITATMATTRGEKTIYLTRKVHGYAVDVNGQIVNVGNEMPNHYLLYFDQVRGLFGLGELP